MFHRMNSLYFHGRWGACDPRHKGALGRRDPESHLTQHSTSGLKNGDTVHASLAKPTVTAETAMGPQHSFFYSQVYTSIPKQIKAVLTSVLTLTSYS